MNCKHCFTPMELIEASDRFLCLICQYSAPVTPVAPAPAGDAIEPLGKASSFQCQKCEAVELEIGRIQSTEVCFCDQCGGCLVDRVSFGELVALLRSRYKGADSGPVAFNPQWLQRQMDCPVCLDPMAAALFCGPGNVVVLTCEGCKISWVEKGDFSRIVRAPGRRCYQSRLPEYSITTNGLFGTKKLNHFG